MRILMLVNWNVQYCSQKPVDKQPPDYYLKSEAYWFYRYFEGHTEVDVIDTHSFNILEKFEHYKLRFYVVQALRAIPKLNKYDLIVSHGMQSGVVISLWRKFFKTKSKHIVVDIGSFNSAAESGMALKMMQFASKSIDGIIYHTSSQINYYQKFFPWILNKAKFIRFGADQHFFKPDKINRLEDKNQYIICVGAGKRDWDTLIAAYRQINTQVKLKIIGRINSKYSGIPGIEQIPIIPINELIDQMYNALFCVLPLEKYNYSYAQMTFLQQMALGKCVLVANAPSLMDYIDNKNAVMYESKNVIDCRDKLITILKNQEFRQEIESNARFYVDSICNEKIMAHEIENFFDEIQNK